MNSSRNEYYDHCPYRMIAMQDDADCRYMLEMYLMHARPFTDIRWMRYCKGRGWGNCGIMCTPEVRCR